MPVHDFLLLPEKGGDYGDYDRFLHDPRSVKVHDDIILYVFDTLKWIPSINPANPRQWPGRGLNYYGPTVINKKGAPKVAHVFHAWATLWEQGPAKLVLTGGFFWKGASPKTGQYAKLVVQRRVIVKAFNAIADAAEKAASGRFYILHQGI